MPEILTSRLAQKQIFLQEVYPVLQGFGFQLGGNWDYEHGYLDKALDTENQVWLRIPFQVLSGTWEGNVEKTNAQVQFGSPFVLHHQYQKQSDPEAKVHIIQALWDQFQEPSNPDAQVDVNWIQQAKQILDQIEVAMDRVTSL